MSFILNYPFRFIANRHALQLRIAIMSVLLLGAFKDYGYEHRFGHWLVFMIYGVGTLIAAAVARSRSAVAQSWVVATAATVIDAALAIYTVANHIPRSAQDPRFGTDAISLLPAFLLLFQTGFRLQRSLVNLFAVIVVFGWILSLFIIKGPYFFTETKNIDVIYREIISIACFSSASIFVLSGVSQIKNAVGVALKALYGQSTLSRFLPDCVASDVMQGGGFSKIAHRHVALVSIDLRNSSRLAREHSNFEFLDWLLCFRGLVHDAVTFEHGIIDKYIGDGILAVFIEGSDQKQAARALGAVRMVFERLEQWNVRRERAGEPQLRVIASLHSGYVLAGIFDDGRRAEFTVMGPAMNELSRIERRAKKDYVHIVASADFISLLTNKGCEGISGIELTSSNEKDDLPEIWSIIISRAAAFRAESTEVAGGPPL